MKKLLLFAIMILYSNLILAQNPKGVLDYFRLLPNELRANFEIQQKNGNYISVDPTTEEELPVILDSKNGYIQIKSDGTGGGTFTLTVVLYRKANRDAVIGVTQNVFDGTVIDHQTQFFSYQNTGYQEITNQILPKLTHATYLKSKMDLEKYRDILEFSKICIELPRYGTTAKSKIAQEHIDNQCLNGNQMACQLKGKFYGNVDLAWDKATGKFRLVAL